MKTKTLLLLLSLSIGVTGFAKTWTVTNNGFAFSPKVLTISPGDSVLFTLESFHNALEVSQANWNANSNTPLSGGFQTAFGGELVLPAQLTTGTHWYVCQPHASMGMKASIVVQGLTAKVNENEANKTFSIYPNPSNGNFTVEMNTANMQILQVFDLTGKLMLSEFINEKTMVDTNNLPTGVYTISIRNNNESVLNKKMVITK